MRCLTTLTSIFLSVILGSAVTSMAGPTSKAPTDAFGVWAQANVQAIAQAEQLDTTARKEILEYEEDLAEGQYTKANKRTFEDIADTALKVYQLKRLATRLIQLKEPAGVDLQERHTELSKRMSDVIGAYRKVEGVAQLSQQALQTMIALSTRHQRSLTSIQALVDRDRLDSAESELDEIFDVLYAPAVFLNGVDSQRQFAPFQKLRGLVDRQMEQRRMQQAEESLAAQRAKELPKYEAINNLVMTAVESFPESGQANWIGKTLDGPGLIAAWGDGLQKTRVKMFTCYALDRLRGLSPGASPPSELDELIEAHGAFEEQMQSAIVALVEADAARVEPSDVPALYTAYLQAIAQISAGSTDDKMIQAIMPALDKLAQRSPEFAAEVAAYERATREALRWRKRAAAAAARRHKQAAPALDPTAYAGQLKQPAPALVEAAAEIVGQQASASGFVPGSSGPFIGRVQLPLYTRIPATKMPDAELAALKQDLLVTDDNPPLTLAAALALETAQAGYYVQAGGEVAGLELDSLLVQFIHNESPALVPLGATTDLSKKGMNDLIWRIDILPTWLQHDYVFFTAP